MVSEVGQFETEILELAVRKVRTPEGSKKFGLPIGAIITADAEAYAKANGFTDLAPEEKPGFKKSAKGKFMAGTISGKAAAEKSAPKAQAPKPLGLKVSKSTISGNKHFKVGEAKYNAPNGSKLIRPASQPGMAYVVTPDGKVHAFNEQGEISIPKPVDGILAQKFGEGFEGDEEYAVEEFEASSASHALPDQKVGSILTDADGTPQFKKLADNSWEHVDLGVKLKDQDLQDLYDSGDLIPDAADDDNNAAEQAFQDTKAMNFAEMSKEEAETALANLPVGQKLTVGETKWTKTGPEQFTSDDGKGGTVKSLAVVKAAIKLGQDPEPEYNPLDGDTVDPLDSTPPKLTGDAPDADWVKSALPGAQMDFESPSGSKTTWTKDEEGDGWTNQRGGKLSQATMLNAVEKSGGDGLSIKKEGKAPKTAAGDAGTPKTPEKKASPAAEEPKPVKLGDEGFFEKATPDQPVYHDGKKFTYDGTYWEDTDGEYAYLPSELENQYEKGTVTDSPYDQVEAIKLPTSTPEPESAPRVKFGEPGYFDNAEEGDLIYVKGKMVVNTDLGWETEDGSKTFGTGELSKLMEAGKVSDKDEYFPEISDLAPDSDADETLDILMAVAPGEQVHPVGSDATLTKVNDDADQIVDLYGENGAEDVGGFWQSSVTGAFVSSKELADLWTGELKPGPNDKAPERPEESPAPATPHPDVPETATPFDPQVAPEFDTDDIVYEVTPGGNLLASKKQPDGSWMTTLPDGSEHPGEESSILDGPEANKFFVQKATPAAPDEYVPSGHTIDPNTGLPEGVPAGSKAIDPLDDLPENGTFYEASGNGQLYTHVAKDGEWKTTLPSGFVIPGNTKEDVEAIMSDPTYEGTFYAAPKGLPDGVPAGSKSWDGDWEQFDSESNSLYGTTPEGEVYEFIATDQDGEFLTYGPGEDGSLTQASDIQNALDQGSLSFHTGAPTKFAKKDDADPVGAASVDWKAGDPLTSPEDFDAVPVGTKLAYLKNNGEYSYYSTLGNGMVLTPGGNQMAVAKLKWASSNGKVSIHELPGGAAPEAEQYLFMDGDPIPHMEGLNSFPVGKKLEMKNADGSHSNFVIKQADGTWKVPADDPNWPGMVFTLGDMSDSIKKGFLFNTGGAQKTDAPAAPEAPEAPAASLWDGAPDMTPEQLQAALTGLEEHTSFHVAYGLKGLPDGHPLKDTDTQNAMKAAALEKYPDLKAKPATMQLLKDALGIKDPEPNWEDALMEAAPTINIGSLTPKKVGVQGMDGGAYTAIDIQDAINILENYPGKLFKNELNKKGNPLGELDPTQIVGFDKDKLVMKQNYIALLKTKLIVTEEQTKHPTVKWLDELNGYPVGTGITYNPETDAPIQHWTKISSDQWHLEDASDFDKSNGLDVANSGAFDHAIKMNKVKLHKLPDEVPDYAKTPAAVKDKEKEQLSTDDPDLWDGIQNAEDGTKMYFGDGSSTKAEKTSPGEWTIWDADGNVVGSFTDKQFYDKINGKDWHFSDVTEDVPTFNANQPLAIIPGKYTTDAGSAFIVVHADGTGTYYVNGEAKKITAEQVMNNYKTGMNKYHGLVKESDLPTPSAPAAKKKPAAKKPKTVSEVPDGLYFAGNPNDGKTSIYEINGDEAKIYKAATGLTASTGVKLGGSPAPSWAEQAGFGASFESHNAYYMGAYVGKVTWTKGKDGKWSGLKLDGTVLEPAADGQPPMGWGYKVTSHGMSEPTTLPKSKVNTLFSQGGLTDQHGMSVLPEGYTGTAMFFGSKTTVPALLNAQKWMDSPEFAAEITDSGKLQEGLKKLGVNFDVHNWHKWRKDNDLTGAGFEPSVEAMKKALADVTDGVDTDIPDADTASLFEWNSLGQAKMPLQLAAKDIPYDKAGRGEWIKEASKLIGDGKVIGLHLTKMDQWDRGQWIDAFNNGDFAKMYQLEVTAAALEGKAHGSGYLHPGFPDNDTKKIAWAAAVEGEISALEDVPGNWTSSNLQMPLAEVDNYLIKAQMQNPTYLSPQQRREWVQAHRAGNKSAVDKLSALAALRKKNGETELSSKPTWTDNIIPAKSYDQLFEGETLPTEGWNSTSAGDYLTDNPSNKDLQDIYAAKQAEGYTGYNASIQAVKQYFQAQKDAHEAELAKVFYQKSSNQKVKKGTHPIYEYDDFNGHGPLGGHYFFKPSPQGDAYRSEAEHLGHEYGWVFGFKTAGSQLIELDGKYGQLQKDLGSKSSLAQFDLSTLNANQIADIGREHILDWFLDNDDTHSENMQMLPDGSLVGIDKGRAFKHFGKWQGLNPSAMNSNAQTIYSRLFQTIQSGKLSKEDVDKAYLQIQKRAQQMAKVDDQKISDMLATGMAKRKIWDVSYKINGKAVPNNLQGLTAAVLDRKNKLPEQIEQMWKDIYAKAGYGDLPEPPPYKLGEDHYSGLDEAHFHENAFKVGSGGVSTLMGGDFSQTGSAIAWNTVNKDGSKEVFTQVELNHVADGKVYAKLQSMNPDATDGSSDPTTFDKDEYGGFFSRDYYRAMATLAKHNDDKQYNQDRISEYQSAKVRLAKDLNAIQGQTLPVPNKEGLIKMPSGALVPQQQLGQYRMMLEFYQGKEAAMDATIATQADFPANDKAKFEPYPLKVKGKNYAHTGLDAQLTELANGDFIYSDPSGAKTVSKDAVPDMISVVGGWKELASEPEGPKSFGGATVQLVNQTFETKGTWDADTGQISTGTAGVGNWTKGSEYKITLPTGETIYFRNRAKTNTLHSQYGRMTIKVPNASSAQDYAAGIERAQDWIASYLDLDMQGADEESAELVYWKQMLPTLTRRSHKSGSKYQKALQDVEKKATELGITLDDFPFRFGEFASVQEMNEFYRTVWGSHFGKDKVDKLISEQGYLPEYEGTDLHNADVTHGRPVWTRFDIDLAELLKSNPKAFVASHNTTGSEGAKNVAVSGSHLSTEERIRFFGGVAGGSSSADQQSGTGGQDQFTRIWDNPSASGYDYVYHPSTLLRTNTRFFANDAFGAESSEKSYANPDPMDWWKNKTSNSGSLGGGNQLDIRWASSWMKSLEMVIFDDIAARDYAIQKLKQAGFEMIRGLPIEDRLVMRKDREKAIAKLREQWQKEAGL